MKTLIKLKSLDAQKKSVLVRTGFDVPIKNGLIKDDFRIRSSLKTIEYLINQKSKIIIVSHLGRPNPEAADDRTKYSLLPVAEHLASLIRRKFIVVEDLDKGLPDYQVPYVYFFPQDLVKDNKLQKVLKQVPEGGIAILENLRFYEGEVGKKMEFAKDLANLADIYVNEAFSNSHRDHASMTLVPKIIPGAAGFHIVEEIEKLTGLLNKPRHPFLALLGGAKLETKVKVLEKLAEVADKILIGGAMANVLLFAKGYEVGKSVYLENEVKLAKQILRDHKDKIFLPTDVVVSDSIDGLAEAKSCDKVASYEMILDIGPKTIKMFSDFIREAKTLVWNGPMGVYEKKQFSHGTYALGRFFASRARGKAYGVVGGGDTLDIVKAENLYDSIDHVSTGGGAMLEFLSGKDLPALTVLEK